jgi:hypothetical protein
MRYRRSDEGEDKIPQLLQRLPTSSQPPAHSPISCSPQQLLRQPLSAPPSPVIPFPPVPAPLTYSRVVVPLPVATSFLSPSIQPHYPFHQPVPCAQQIPSPLPMLPYSTLPSHSHTAVEVSPPLPNSAIPTSSSSDQSQQTKKRRRDKPTFFRIEPWG